MQREGLLGVARRDAVGAHLLDALEQSRLGVVAGEGRLLRRLEDEVVVGRRRLDAERRGGERALHEERVEGRLVRHLDREVAAAQLLDVADLDRLVVLGEQVERPCLEPQVDVLGDEDDAAAGLRLAQPQRGAEDAVVVGVAAEDARRLGQLAVVGQHAHAPRRRAVERDPLAQQVAAREGVELADELPRLQVHHAVALLELVELLEHGDRHRHVVLLEVLERLAVVEDHRGVEDEDLGAAGGGRNSGWKKRTRRCRGARPWGLRLPGCWASPCGGQPKAGGMLELRGARRGGREVPGEARSALAGAAKDREPRPERRVLPRRSRGLRRRGSGLRADRSSCGQAILARSGRRPLYPGGDGVGTPAGC